MTLVHLERADWTGRVWAGSDLISSVLIGRVGRVRSDLESADCTGMGGVRLACADWSVGLWAWSDLISSEPIVQVGSWLVLSVLIGQARCGRGHGSSLGCLLAGCE